MTSANAQDDLSIVQRLIAAARNAPRDAGEQEPAEDYDWSVPCRYTVGETETIQTCASATASEISKTLGSYLGREIATQPLPIAMFYARKLPEIDHETPLRLTHLLCGGNVCGYVAIPAALAIGWVSQLLGAVKVTGGGERELSSLEEDLLMDIMGELVRALSSASKASGGSSFSRGDELMTGPETLPESHPGEYCRFSLQLSGDDSDAVISFAILCDVLDPLVGGPDAAREETPEIRHKKILPHLGHVCVQAEAHLGTAFVTMRDLVALEPGDVLVLDRRAGEPVNLLVDGKEAFLGIPATSQDKYALQIHSICDG